VGWVCTPPGDRESYAGYNRSRKTQGVKKVSPSSERRGGVRSPQPAEVPTKKPPVRERPDWEKGREMNGSPGVGTVRGVRQEADW